MQTFDGVLEEMIRAGIVDRDVALPYASNQGNLLLRLTDFGAKTRPPEAAPAEDSMLDLIEH
jgi:hypothetical protein